MDILSYQQAMKAKKAIKKLNDRIGVGESASGDPADYVDGVDKTVKERLETLEAKDPKITLYNRVSELEAHTAINLNKHNLFLKSVLDKSRFNLINLVYEDFSDDSRIDKDKSQNYTFDPVRQKVTPSDPQTPAEIVTVATPTDTPPTIITISQLTNDLTQVIKSFDLVNGTHTNTASVNDQVQLASPNDGQTFYLNGVYESPVLDLGDDFKDIIKINQIIDMPSLTDVKIPASYQIYTSTSSDGIQFSEWQPINSDGTINSVSARYIKIKLELNAQIEERKNTLAYTGLDNNITQTHNQLSLKNQAIKLKRIRNIHMNNPSITSNTVIKSVNARKLLNDGTLYENIDQYSIAQMVAPIKRIKSIISSYAFRDTEIFKSNRNIITLRSI